MQTSTQVLYVCTKYIMSYHHLTTSNEHHIYFFYCNSMCHCSFYKQYQSTDSHFTYTHTPYVLCVYDHVKCAQRSFGNIYVYIYKFESDMKSDFSLSSYFTRIFAN